MLSHDPSPSSNERKGVPVELLNAVDKCVEIPQAGSIRSLNVHVSGGIAIWMHFCQSMFDKPKDSVNYPINA